MILSSAYFNSFCRTTSFAI